MLAKLSDDCILLMASSRGSLQSALSTFKIVGFTSGLKMNTMKTKVVWIG